MRASLRSSRAGGGRGSGPGRPAGDLDRQMGIVTIDGKPMAVSIASLPSSGSHESGTRALTEIARWLVSNAERQGAASSSGLLTGSHRHDGGNRWTCCHDGERTGSRASAASWADDADLGWRTS